MTNSDVTTSRVAVSVAGVSKAFLGTPVLRDVDLELLRGEVHCLVGGNGSGKSTLIKTIAGVYRADSGQVQTPDGESHDARELDPTRAKSLGIHTVHQEPSIFLTLSVAENLFLGDSFPMRMGRIDRKALRSEAQQVLQRFGIHADPDQPLASLRPAMQTLVAVARALHETDEDTAGVLILDEPTATMAASEVEVVLAAVSRYATEGHAIILVTHRLEEVLAIADRITVLRDGAVVATRTASELDRASLANLIIGRELDDRRVNEPSESDETVLEIRGLCAGTVNGSSLSINRKEIVGIASLSDGGGTDFLEAIFGLRPVEAGTIHLNGHQVVAGAPRAMLRRGVSYVSQDRSLDGAFSPLTVRENLTVSRLRQFWRASHMAGRSETSYAGTLVEKFGVLPSRTDALMSKLSGGNQQKVVLARSLAANPTLVLIDEPTQGVDVGARADIHNHLRQAAASGSAVITVSSDLDELLRLCHRIVVFAGGEIVADRPAQLFEQAELVTLMNNSTVKAVPA